jgi:hypothetical protein
MSAELLYSGLTGIEACTGLRSLSPALQETVLRKEIELHGIEIGDEEFMQSLSLLQTTGEPRLIDEKTTQNQRKVDRQDVSSDIPQAKTYQTVMRTQNITSAENKNNKLFVAKTNAIEDFTLNAQESTPKTNPTRMHRIDDLPPKVHLEAEQSLAPESEAGPTQIVPLITADTMQEEYLRETVETTEMLNVEIMLPEPIHPNSEFSSIKEVRITDVLPFYVGSSLGMPQAPEDFVSPEQTETAEIAELFEQIESAIRPAEEPIEHLERVLSPSETLDSLIELAEIEPAGEMELDVGDIEIEITRMEIAELTTELNSYFSGPLKTEPLEYRTALPVSEIYDSNQTYATNPKLEVEIAEELFMPFIEIKPVGPSLVDAVLRLEMMFTVASEEQSELTQQIVEDIIITLRYLGCEEPKRILLTYAKNHSIAELFDKIKIALPELTKLIDYQQHLLAVQARTNTYTDRHISIAEVLGRLLFVTSRQVAVLAT